MVSGVLFLNKKLTALVLPEPLVIWKNLVMYQMKTLILVKVKYTRQRHPMSPTHFFQAYNSLKIDSELQERIKAIV